MGRGLLRMPVSRWQRSGCGWEQVYSRGRGPWVAAGPHHQGVVEGRAPRHRGVQIGRVAEVLFDRVVISGDTVAR